MTRTYVNKKEISLILEEAPEGCGVYLIRDGEGNLLYIGKSVKIRKRMADHSKAALQGVGREEMIIGGMVSAEYIITANELEALILENDLIKRHQPRYNIVLRDDKNYPYLRVDIKNEFPRVTVVRSSKQDKALYFGPYVSAAMMRKTLRYLGKFFPLRTCRNESLPMRTRPCLDFEIGRCLAPCTGHVSRDEYREVVREVILFLKGRRLGLKKHIEKKMDRASRDMRYEEAARFRDRLRDLSRFFERQSIYGMDLPSADVIGIAKGQGGWLVYTLFVRHGTVVGGEPYYLEKGSFADEKTTLQIFTERFYATRRDIPAEVILPAPIPGKELLEKYLRARGGRTARVSVPSRGRGLELLMIARKNALASLDKREKKVPMPEAQLWTASGIVRGTRPPARIEVYDASSTQSSGAVAGMVVWDASGFKRSDYRRFRIKASSGSDDYAMIREALSRRAARITSGREPSPDLVLVDGGAGHVSSARAQLDNAGLEAIPVLGISKGDRSGHGDRLHLEDGAYLDLPHDSPLLVFCGRLRDEVHRWAVGYHRKLRAKALKASMLDEIRGLGPRRKAILVNYFGDIRSIASAGMEELTSVPGIPEHVGRAVHEFFHKHDQ